VIAIDDAELLDPVLLDRFASAVVDRVDGRTLLVVACDPGSEHMARLLRRDRLGDLH